MLMGTIPTVPCVVKNNPQALYFSTVTGLRILFRLFPTYRDTVGPTARSLPPDSTPRYHCFLPTGGKLTGSLKPPVTRLGSN